jgi:hypothetical protein
VGAVVCGPDLCNSSLVMRCKMDQGEVDDGS